jgi:hypothetical protein
VKNISAQKLTAGSIGISIYGHTNKRHANNLHLDVTGALKNAICSHHYRDDEAVKIAS